MNVDLPDSASPQAQQAVQNALDNVSNRGVGNPYNDAEELTLTEEAVVDELPDGDLLIRMQWPHGIVAYRDANARGDDAPGNSGEAPGNPAPAAYDALAQEGIEAPADDPNTGVVFDRENDAVEIQARVDPAVIESGGGNGGGN